MAMEFRTQVRLWKPTLVFQLISGGQLLATIHLRMLQSCTAEQCCVMNAPTLG
ncbi:hypothetical protein C8R31_101383 [Nitrosospira sp. Nsp2]|nr:hypothetical protein C8R31_101383 [Nitrosospira sp. Nsp2]